MELSRSIGNLKLDQTGIMPSLLCLVCRADPGWSIAWVMRDFLGGKTVMSGGLHGDVVDVGRHGCYGHVIRGSWPQSAQRRGGPLPETRDGHLQVHLHHHAH